VSRQSAGTSSGYSAIMAAESQSMAATPIQRFDKFADMRVCDHSVIKINANSTVYCISQISSNLYLGGSFTTYKGTDTLGLIKISSIDASVGIP
jgi:hypothetical protein